MCGEYLWWAGKDKHRGRRLGTLEVKEEVIGGRGGGEKG